MIPNPSPTTTTTTTSTEFYNLWLQSITLFPGSHGVIAARPYNGEHVLHANLQIYQLDGNQADDILSSATAEIIRQAGLAGFTLPTPACLSRLMARAVEPGAPVGVDAVFDGMDQPFRIPDASALRNSDSVFGGVYNATMGVITTILATLTPS